MPRPERPLDPSAGPVQEFAAQLRGLRADAGRPKYLQMSRATGRSRTALAEAAGGDHLPTWETVEAFVTACGAAPDDLTPWRLRWERVADEVQERRRTPAPGPRTEPAAATAAVTGAATGAVTKVDGKATRVGRSDRRDVEPVVVLPALTRARVMLLAAVLTMVAIVSGSATAALLVVSLSERTGTAERPGTGSTGSTGGADGGDRRVPAAGGVVSVEITEIESMPVVPAGRPVDGCEDDPDCRLPGIELWAGDRWTVFCYTSGDVMKGWHLGFVGPAAEQDPRNQQSNGWYGARTTDGRIGFLPEVYVRPEYRGGLGLGPCWPNPSLEPR